MTKHPIWSLSDDYLEVVLTHAKAPASLRNAVRAARQGGVDDKARQRLLAEWNAHVQPDGFVWPWVALSSTTGPLPMGEMAVVLAQSGEGKSTFTGSLLNRLGQTPALVFATETKDERYRIQMAARRAGLHPAAAVLGEWRHASRNMSAEDAKQRYAQANDELDALPIAIAPYLSLRTSQMVDCLKRAVDNAEHPPQVIVVDHFQAIHHDCGEGVSAQQETLRLLHEFADTEYVTMIVTNQAHLRGQGGPPKRTDCIDLAGNFGGQSLMQYAAQVIGLHRVFAPTMNGIAITPEFLKAYRERKGNERELYDKTKVAVDIAKSRYDLWTNAGQEVYLQYRDGQYWDIDE